MERRLARGGGPPPQPLMDLAAPMSKRPRLEELAYPQWGAQGVQPRPFRGRGLGYRGQMETPRQFAHSPPKMIDSYGESEYGSDEFYSEEPFGSSSTHEDFGMQPHPEEAANRASVSVDYHHGQDNLSIDQIKNELLSKGSLSDLRSTLESRIEESKAFISSLIKLKEVMTDTTQGVPPAKSDACEWAGPGVIPESSYSEGAMSRRFPVMGRGHGQSRGQAIRRGTGRGFRGGEVNRAAMMAGQGTSHFIGQARHGQARGTSRRDVNQDFGKRGFYDSGQTPSQGPGQFGKPGMGRGHGSFSVRGRFQAPASTSGSHQKKLPFAVAFKNFANRVKRCRVQNMLPDMFESLLEEVGLWSALVSKREKTDDVRFTTHKFDLYINNVHLSSGMDANRISAKKKAYKEASSLLMARSDESILISQPRIDLEALKSEADIIESPHFSTESNYSNVVSQRETPEPVPLKDFVILEPSGMQEGANIAATCILRQSADFSHMFLLYTFKPDTEDQKELMCSLYLENQFMGQALGGSKSVAKNAVSTIVLEKLQKSNFTIQIKKTPDADILVEDILEQFGHLSNENERDAYEEKLLSYFDGCFSVGGEKIEMAIPVENLSQLERDVIFCSAKKAKLVAELRHATEVDGKTKYIKPRKGKMTSINNQFLVLNRKLSCKELLEHLLSKGGESYRYRLRKPEEN